MNTLKELIKIRDGAPEGVTHIWETSESPLKARSLSDISRIIELEQQLKTAKADAVREFKDSIVKQASKMPSQLECKSKGSSCYNWAMFYALKAVQYANQLEGKQ